MLRSDKNNGAAGEPILIPVTDVARLLGVSVRYGWALVHAGKLTSIKLGRRRLVPRAAVEAFVREVQQNGVLG